MQIGELSGVLDFIEEAVAGDQPQALYNELVGLLNQARQGPSEGVSEQLQAKRAELTSFHDSINIERLTFIERRLMAGLGGEDVLGPQALSKLNKIFEDYSLDPAGAASEVEKLKQSVDALKNRVSHVRQGLGSLLDYHREDIDEDQGIVTLVFEREVSVDTIGGLQNAAKDWVNRLSAFSRFAGDPGEDPRLLSIEKGSLYIELGMAAGAVAAVGAAITSILGAVEKVLEIRKKALEIRNMENVKDEIADQMDAGADDYRREQAERIVEELMKGKKVAKGENKNEVNTGLKKAVESMFVFVEKGGRVDIYLESGDEDAETTASLASGYDSLRRLEGEVSELRLLVGGNESGSAAPDSEQ